MGGSHSSPSESVSADLWTLGSPETPLEAKTAAFRRLRAHFVPGVSKQQKLTVLAAVEAQRFPLWVPPPTSASSLGRERLADRVRGLFFGAALGDATGLATEFMSAEEVERFYAGGFAYCPQPEKIRPDTHRMMWESGDWTDDTDQLVCTQRSPPQQRAPLLAALVVATRKRSQRLSPVLSLRCRSSSCSLC